MSAPEIRFPEFKEPWRPTVAGAAFKHSRARGEAGLPIYSVTLDRGMVRRDSLDRHMESDAADGQNLRAQPGDIVYNMMRMWQGAVGVAPEECMVSPAYVVLRPTKETNPQFFNYWFQTSRMLHKLGAYSHGLTKDRLRLYPDDFSKIPLHLPTRAEQDRIAAFFEDIDAKLAALRETADGLRQFKIGLMQRLFSQELRFTREDGSDFPDWDERELQEIGERSKVKNSGIKITRVLTNSATMGVIDQGDYFDKDIANAENIGGYYVIRKGEFIYNPRISVSAPVGPINRNDLADGVMSPLYTVFRINLPDTDFFAHYFASTMWHDYMKSVANYGARHDRMAISIGDFLALPLPVPHADERAKIAGALSALDAKIDAMTAQITHMEAFKKGLLQKMFV